jgi:hypothetical protein
MIKAIRSRHVALPVLATALAAGSALLPVSASAASMPRAAPGTSLPAATGCESFPNGICPPFAPPGWTPPQNPPPRSDYGWQCHRHPHWRPCRGGPNDGHPIDNGPVLIGIPGK